MLTIEKIPVIGKIVKTNRALNEKLDETVDKLKNGGGDKLKRCYEHRHLAAK